MNKLIDKNTRVVVLGMTGKEGGYWTEKMMEMGTKVVAGVTPGRGGNHVLGIPVFNTVSEALAHTPADACLLFVPPRAVLGAALEVITAGIKLIVNIAENIPLHDTIKIRAAAIEAGVTMIGGNTSGVIAPGQAMLGCFPYWIERVYRPGRIGVMTRSGSLTNEVTSMVVEAGFGVSTLVGVGGDQVPGCRFAELLPYYQADAETDAVVIIGELGGTMEEEVAEAILNGVFNKNMVAFLGGRTAPEGRRMGHAGAIVNNGRGSVAGKIKLLEKAGVAVAKTPRETGQLLLQVNNPDMKKATRKKE